MPAIFRARRRFGQNFLVDPRAVERIVDALAPAPSDAVLEIGPGRAALTGALIGRAGRIAAVELDRDLADELERRFPPQDLVLFRGDVLRLAFADVLGALGRSPDAAGGLAVVGNLPYNVSKPVALKLVEERRRVDRAVLTFQREVARRLTARTGQRDYGPLAVLVGLAFEVRPLFDLGPGAFRPRPRVTSTVTGWRPRPSLGWLDRHEPALRRCLRACFARRRRTLFNNLRGALGDDGRAGELLDACGLEGGSRPGTVPPEGYVRMTERWPASGGSEAASP